MIIDLFSGTGTEQTKKKADAVWSANLYVECPYCGEIIDILKAEEWKDDWAYKFGALENKENLNAEVECPRCKLIFVVGNVEW